LQGWAPQESPPPRRPPTHNNKTSLSVRACLLASRTMSGFHYRVHKDQQIPELGSGGKDVEPGFLLDNLQRDIEVEIQSLSDDEIVFDLVGVDVSIANALRRIMMSEVPTVAVEHVWISANSGIVQDEILAHRLGLVPIKVDPRTLEDVIDEPTDADTLTFHLDVVYPRNDEEKAAYPTATDVSEGCADKEVGKVFSRHLKWLPQGNQSVKYPEGITAVHPDILLAELRPGQRIEFEAHCRKGVGKDHAKFSPVATASYRLLPDIDFLQPVTGARAEELVAMCPLKVFDIEDLGAGAGGGGGKKAAGAGDKVAVVARPRDCTMCRECIRKEGWSERVRLRRKSDHFIFTVESTGCLKPHEIVREALQILKEKADKFARLAEAHQAGGL